MTSIMRVSCLDWEFSYLDCLSLLLARKRCIQSDASGQEEKRIKVIEVDAKKEEGLQSYCFVVTVILLLDSFPDFLP